MSDTTVATANHRFDAWLIIALGLLQGAAIAMLVNDSINLSLSSSPWLQSSLWGWTLLLPPTAQWLIAYRGRLSYWLLLGFVALAIPAICWEPARSILPEMNSSQQDFLASGGMLAWAAVMSLASAALHSGGIADYPGLFRLTCRTILLPLGAQLFSLFFWLLLTLCAALFELLGIDLFQRLFRGWFLWPVLGVAYGIATAILIDRPALVDGVRRVGTAIAAALLPVAVIIHLLFLGGIAVVGLEPLWATRHATPLVLTLVGIFLLLLNGTHEEGTKLDCLPRPVAGIVRLALVLSPIYVAIAAYSLWLRVAQYGWSPDRVIGACVTAFIGLVLLAYVVAAARKPFFILPRLAVANVGALAGLAIIGIAVNSPLLSPKRIAAASQEQRILTGRTAPETIDWRQLGFELGSYGRSVVHRLASVTDIPRAAEIRQRADDTLATPPERRYGLMQGPAPRIETPKFSVVPGNSEPPPGLVDIVRARFVGSPSSSSCAKSGVCKLLAIDLNGDGQPEMILLDGNLPVYRQQNGRWMYFGVLAGLGTPPMSVDEIDAVTARLAEGRGRSVAGEWQDVEVDGRRLRIR